MLSDNILMISKQKSQYSINALEISAEEDHINKWIQYVVTPFVAMWPLSTMLLPTDSSNRHNWTRETSPCKQHKDIGLNERTHIPKLERLNQNIQLVLVERFTKEWKQKGVTTHTLSLSLYKYGFLHNVIKLKSILMQLLPKCYTQ